MDEIPYRWVARAMMATALAYAFAHSISILLCQLLIQLLQLPSADSLLGASLTGLVIYITVCVFCFSTTKINLLFWSLLAGITLSWTLALLNGFAWGAL